jgi:sortase (surface protein transpeptidase)
MMHASKFSIISVCIVTALAIAVFSWTAVHALLYAPDSEVKVATSMAPHVETTYTASEDIPARLSIPSLKIDAAIQSLGVNAKGNMASPSNFRDVGWYKYGPTPGQKGSAVIDGHVDNGLGLSGVFKDLHKIAIGADIFIETKNGERLRFIVVEVESYPYKGVPVDRLFTRSDDAYLNLVTCGGTWVKADKTYDQRLVVYTKLAGV